MLNVRNVSMRKHIMRNEKKLEIEPVCDFVTRKNDKLVNQFDLSLLNVSFPCAYLNETRFDVPTLSQ